MKISNSVKMCETKLRNLSKKLLESNNIFLAKLLALFLVIKSTRKMKQFADFQGYWVVCTACGINGYKCDSLFSGLLVIYSDGLSRDTQSQFTITEWSQGNSASNYFSSRGCITL